MSVRRTVFSMAVSSEPITLTPQQIEELNQKLSHMRHEINNHLSLVIAAAELIRFKPELREKMALTMADQPKKISQEMANFSAEFEKFLNISRD